MADIAGLRQKLGQEQGKLAELQVELQVALDRYNQAVANGLTPGTAAAVNLRRSLGISSLQADVETQQGILQETLTELTSAEQDLATPTTSAGQTVAQEQQANDEKANVVSPRSEPDPNQAITNADQFNEAANQDAGTDDDTRTLQTTQSLPPPTAAPGGALGRIVAPNTPGQVIDPFADDDYTFTPTAQAGGGSASDDGISNYSTGVRAQLNSLFSGQITPQANVLDQYSSYTYAISIYLMDARDYRAFLNDPKAVPPGSQLLIQSAGAPQGGGAKAVSEVDTVNIGGENVAVEDPGQVLAAQVKDLKRNPFFTLDYYIDDLEIKSVINGKGSNGAHNVTELKFKIIEPNGITFLENLYRATAQYVRLSGSPQVNYAAQNYLMAIRFYGYDKDGNLVLAQNQPFVNPYDGRTIETVVEKFIPFQFNNIRFRVSNRMIEYNCECTAVRDAVAGSSARGTIPFNVELVSQSLRDLLGGQAQYASAAQDTQGRPTANAPTVAAGVRDTPNEAPSPFQVGA